MLVLTDVYFPGWQAIVDGRSTPVRRVDYLLRGVAVSPGRHTVEFRYRPTSWRVGWMLSGLTLIGLVVLLLLTRRGSRRPVRHALARRSRSLIRPRMSP